MLIGVEGTSLGQRFGEPGHSRTRNAFRLLIIKLCLSLLSQSIFLISHQSSRAAIFIIAIKFLLVYHGNSMVIVRHEGCEERPARRQCGES